MTKVVHNDVLGLLAAMTLKNTDPHQNRGLPKVPKLQFAAIREEKPNSLVGGCAEEPKPVETEHCF